MMKKILFFLFIVPGFSVSAQDVLIGRKMLDTLTSTHFWGRGYTNDGLHKAANFLASKFKDYGLSPLYGKSFFQNFNFPVNTFPGAMEVEVNGKKLVAGADFIVSPESRGIKASGKLQLADSVTFENPDDRIIFKVENKLTWSVSRQLAGYTMVQLNKNSMKEKPVSFSVKIENSFVEKFAAANICAFVKGTMHPDSFLVVTAHYDHLGGMGKTTYFPGANDNASGVSLMMELARYYAQNPQPYSIAFIAFAGEEAGLIGSKYFTENPLVPLTSIRFLLNTDLAGTGTDGITVVNATEFPKEFAWMNQVNDENKLLVKINSRGKAANSDHYFFTEKGVPSFFFYTLGGVTAYHDIYDRAEALPLSEFEDLFKLIVLFNNKLMGK